MNIEDKLSSLVAMSEQLLELAKSGEWETLAEMESQRSPEIESFFKSLNPDAFQKNSELLKSSIDQIMGLDKQVVAIAAEYKKSLAELMKKSNSTRKAMSEYQNNTAL